MNLSSLAAARRLTKGFSLIELTYVSAMSVAVLGAAVLSYRAITIQQTKSTNYGVITIGEAYKDFYGVDRPTINTWFAPNYGRGIRAEELRELFYADVETASAVFGLPRAGRSSVRPNTVAILAPPQLGSVPGIQIDTPNAFLALLDTFPNSFSPTAANTFSAYHGLPPDTAPNASIFIIQPSLHTEPNQLTVRCVWEIDFVPVVGSSSTPGGTYATVRRYAGSVLTHYYDTFYKDDSSPFGPVLVHFERAARAGTTGNDAFKRAGAQSFYFMWWPDPSASNMRPGGSAPTALNGDAMTDFRTGYANHYGQTSLFFVVPMFPCVQ